MSHQSLHIAPDRFPLASQVSGAPNAPPLLLLQGQANSHRWWDSLRPAIDRHFRTITLDYRGTGDSRGPVGTWTIDSFVADVIVVLDGLGIRQVAVYGTSMGGRVAQVLAARHPERVSALVLACTSPGGSHAVERGPDVRRALAGATPDERTDLLHDLFFTPDWPPSPQDALLLGDPSMSAQEATAHLRVSDRHDAWEFLPSITAPTLVLHGGQDQMAPVINAHTLADRIPGAQLHIVEEGRHGFFVEFASEVLPRAMDFLDSTRA